MQNLSNASDEELLSHIFPVATVKLLPNTARMGIAAMVS